MDFMGRAFLPKENLQLELCPSWTEKNSEAPSSAYVSFKRKELGMAPAAVWIILFLYQHIISMLHWHRSGTAIDPSSKSGSSQSKAIYLVRSKPRLLLGSRVVSCCILTPSLPSRSYTTTATVALGSPSTGAVPWLQPSCWGTSCRRSSPSPACELPAQLGLLR